MYTILVNDDNSLTTSIGKRIMQNSKNVDELHFLVKSTYNDVDMTDSKVVLTYILPISKERKTLVLTKSEELYKERLEYKISLDNDENFITSEVGDVRMWLTIMNGDDMVRYTTPTLLTVVSAEAVDIIPNKPIEASTPDDIYFDRDTNQIYLTAGGTAIGGSISVSDLSNAIVDTTNDGLISVITE